MSNRVAVMQPYIFPYLGYFQLVAAVDHFVFYDDVNYIKGGWINRNKILGGQNELLFTVPLSKASPNKKIKDIEINKQLYEKWKIKFLKSLYQSYKKAPFFGTTYELIERILNSKASSIADLATASITEITYHLGLDINFLRSSKSFSESADLDREERLYHICNTLKSNHYINSIGGKELYTKEEFEKKGIQLSFIQPGNNIIYKQLENTFVPWLSIIDVLMFNNPPQTKKLLYKHTLV